ncbi:MAG: alpha-glucosidase [Lachnospiraceae bacterium]|nr:alpha-glucosidase [Lachnospiraceae bacterium]
MRRYVFGHPIETEAVLEKPPVTTDVMTELQVGASEEFPLTFSMEMDEDDIVYGLGENVRGINKRGWLYTSHNSDDPNHDEGKHSLYASHNFLLISGKKHLGLFFDTPGEVLFDVGYQHYNQLVISLPEGDVEVYTMEADSDLEVIRQFRHLIGKSYRAPKWAFGYGQCRWSYMTSDEVREVVQTHRKMGIPLDMLYLDIDYLDAYKDFTTNPKTFGDFDALVSDMQKEHIHLVPIIDAGVKMEDGYDFYEEGKRKGYFCKDENGEDFVVGVWPGDCCLPDMLNDEARAWFGDGYKFLLDKGIDGFWNDMNEPALFYSRKHLAEVFEQVGSFAEGNLDIQRFFEFKDMMTQISNNEEDYKSFYHNYKGQKIRHDKVHNLYGYYMTRSASEAFARLVPNREVLMFSRSSYIGMHRYAGIWQGDNKSWWSHLLMNLKMMPSLNMCGFLYTGADLGGFGDQTTEDLMIRWLSLGIFTPLMRNHSAMGTRMQEVYRFDAVEKMKGIIQLRYRLIPYLYQAYEKAINEDTMMFYPLGMVYPTDAIARRVEDQLLVGDDVMIAPIYEQNAVGRVVYLPEEMTLLRFRGAELVEQTPLPAGHHYVEMPLGDVCMFLRDGHQLQLARIVDSVADLDWDNLTFV